VVGERDIDTAALIVRQLLRHFIFNCFKVHWLPIQLEALLHAWHLRHDRLQDHFETCPGAKC
jgi:hypothetical protein